MSTVTPAARLLPVRVRRTFTVAGLSSSTVALASANWTCPPASSSVIVSVTVVSGPSTAPPCGLLSANTIVSASSSSWSAAMGTVTVCVAWPAANVKLEAGAVKSEPSVAVPLVRATLTVTPLASFLPGVATVRVTMSTALPTLSPTVALAFCHWITPPSSSSSRITVEVLWVPRAGPPVGPASATRRVRAPSTMVSFSSGTVNVRVVMPGGKVSVVGATGW